MNVDIEQFHVSALIGLGLVAVLSGLLILLVPATFVWFTWRGPRAWTALRILLFGLGLWLLATLLFAVAVLATAGRGGYVVLLLLSPLCIVYGIRKARRRMAEMEQRGRGLGLTLLRLLPLPLFVFICFNVALTDLYGIERGGVMPDSIWTGNATLDFVLGILRLLGYGALYLFFLTVPYIGGSAVAAVLLVLDGMGVDWEALLGHRDTPGAISSDERGER